MHNNLSTKSPFLPTNSDPYVHEAAARLFWTSAVVNGFQATESAVLESRGASILTRENINHVIQSGAFPNITDILNRPDGQTAVALDAYEHAQSEKNMIGMFYQDELSGGRDYSASRTRVDRSLNVKPKTKVMMEKLPSYGKLFLRTPLPSVVLVRSEPESTIFEVHTTTKALGFEYPMIMMGESCNFIAPGIIAVTGTLSIPVPSNEWHDKWLKIIPNSHGHINSFKAFLGSQTGETTKIFEYNYDWG